MKIEQKIFVALVLSVAFLSYPAVAESGSIEISNEATTTYQTDWGPFPGSIVPIGDWIHYDSANINYIDSFTISYSTFPSYVFFLHEYEQAFCHFTAGASGSWLYMSYNRNTASVYYAFSSDTILTSSPIKFLCSDDSKITSNVTINGIGGWGTPKDDWSVGEVFLNASSSNSDVYHPVGVYMNVTTGIRGTDYYSVTYPIPEYFSVAVTKNSYVETKYIIQGVSSIYSQESEFNKDSFAGASFFQNDGIMLSVILASGVNTSVWVNLSGTEGYIIETDDDTPPEIDPITGAGIKFTRDSYYLGDTANISWKRTITTPLLYHDYIVHFKPWKSGDVCDIDSEGYCGVVLVDSPDDIGSHFVNLDRVGVHRASFLRFSIGIEWALEWQTLASDTTVVSYKPSYLLMNSTVLTKTSIPIRYFIGQNLNGYIDPSGTKSMMMLEIREYDGTDFISPRYYNIMNNSGTVFHIFPLPKQYKVSLFDYLRGEQLYEKIVTGIYSPNDIVVEKIKTSYISIDKSIFYYGEMISGSYGIDDTNYSGYNIIVSLLNETNGNVYCSYNAGENFDLKTGTYLYDFVQQSGNYYMGCEKAVGSANITLYRNNNSILQKITSVSFNISNTNDAGYGLKISPMGCQKFSISATSPGIGKIEVLDYNGKVEKLYNFSGTLNTIISTKTKSQYTFNIFSPSGTLEISKVVPGSSDCDGTTPGTTPKTGLPGGTDTTVVLLNSPWLYASIIVVSFALAGGAAAGPLGFLGGFSVGTIFAYIGGLIPMWALFVFVLTVILMLSLVVAGKFAGGGE